ncbi:hypothetical protein TcWFU_005276 [Taenia crassiceps]|uniref:Uncharacterized protein n=1 Tax=Taenia crassiceps TaxID=6207 RepID=A0ABR4Q6E8_9CEST
MSNNPGVGGSRWSISVGTTTATPSGRARRPHTHRMERLGVDFAISTTTTATKIEPEAVSTPRTEAQSFSRMPSQRRRRLWTLAARAAARREHPSQDKEALSSGSLASKHLGESSTQSSSFLKPGTVRTQDSGISSMDYVTSREANSPNSEEAGSRQRASISLTTAEHPPGVCRQPPPQPLPSHPSDVALKPRGCRWPPPRATKIVVSGETPTLRYADFCSTYVPEWARRNWSSAPRPLISRQRSSMEVSYDTGPDWAASMETLNMQRALYPQIRGLLYGRYGRASCPKATSCFDNPFPTIHMEEESVDEEENSRKRAEAESAAVAVADHLRRRRFEAPCWCERPPLPPPHTCSLRCRTGVPAPTSMLSPYFYCSGCPYRCMETGLMPVHQYDLAQRHIRRRRLKRMSSEPTPPTWMAAEEAPAPAKRRPPPPEPLTLVTSPPPLPRKNTPAAHVPPLRLPQALPPPPTERMYSEVRMVKSTPRTDVFLMTPEPSTAAGEWRRWRSGGGGGRLMRGRSVDEAFYSPRWERHSFLSDPRRPTYIYEEEEVKDWYPPQRRMEVEPVSGLSHPYHPHSAGVPYGIRPSSCRTVRTPSVWYSTSPRCAPFLRPRSESGSRPPLLHTCALRFRGHRTRCATRSSAASSLESSDATAATAATTPGAVVAAAPPWQLTSPLSTVRHHGAPAAVPVTKQRKATRGGGAAGGNSGGGSAGGSNDSTMGARRKRRQLAPLSKNADASTGGTQRELDVKWKRKSFKRSNGYDAADVMDHTSPSCPEQIELLPLNQEAHPPPQNTTTTTMIVHESHDDNEENVDGTSFAIATPPIASPSIATTTTAGIRKSTTPVNHDDGNAEVVVEGAEEEEDIDKVIALVTRPRSGPSGGSLLRAQKSVVQEAGGSGGGLITLGFINHNDYWEHSAFGRSRIAAIVLAFVAICCLLYCLVATTWAYSGPPGNLTRRGLWQKCSVGNGSCELTVPFLSETDGWQGGTTCILLVAILVGLLGTGLAILGHSGSDLVKRLYYFHSSGEIFFLAGFTTFLTFGIYRSYANFHLLNPRQTSPNSLQESHHSHTATVPTTTSTVSPIRLPQLRWNIYYGSADSVGWSGGVLFMAAAIALLVDEFLYELARLGQTRWPRLGRCLHWCAHHISSSNRRLRNTHRRCLGVLCRKSTTVNFSVPAIEVPYRPTTGAGIERHRRWRLRRQ